MRADLNGENAAQIQHTVSSNVPAEEPALAAISGLLRETHGWSRIWAMCFTFFANCNPRAATLPR